MYFTINKVRNAIIMEHIISFLHPNDIAANQFHVQLVGISYPDPNYIVNRENSNIYSIEYIIDGEGTIQIDDEVYYPSKGDIYILPQGRNHHYYSSAQNPWTKIWMNVSGSVCDLLIRAYHLENTYLIKNLDLCYLFEKFLTCCEQKDIAQNVLSQQCALVFHEILIKISAHLHEDIQKTNTLAFDIKQYIDKNIYEKLSIQKISEAICLSSSQINRVFKNEFHQTPYDYILSRKIETSKLLLSNTNLSIKQVAFRLNFADEHYFSNCFKAKTGVPPGKYAKQPTNHGSK